jgi:hypothetical protein
MGSWGLPRRRRLRHDGLEGACSHSARLGLGLPFRISPLAFPLLSVLPRHLRAGWQLPLHPCFASRSRSTSASMNGFPGPQAQQAPPPPALQQPHANSSYEHIVALMQNPQTAQPLIMAASTGQVPSHIVEYVKQYVQANMPILSGMQSGQTGELGQYSLCQYSWTCLLAPPASNPAANVPSPAGASSQQPQISASQTPQAVASSQPQQAGQAQPPSRQQLVAFLTQLNSRIQNLDQIRQRTDIDDAARLNAESEIVKLRKQFAQIAARLQVRCIRSESQRHIFLTVLLACSQTSMPSNRWVPLQTTTWPVSRQLNKPPCVSALCKSLRNNRLSSSNINERKLVRLRLVASSRVSPHRHRTPLSTSCSSRVSPRLQTELLSPVEVALYLNSSSKPRNNRCSGRLRLRASGRPPTPLRLPPAPSAVAHLATLPRLPQVRAHQQPVRYLRPLNHKPSPPPRALPLLPQPYRSSPLSATPCRSPLCWMSPHHPSPNPCRRHVRRCRAVSPPAQSWARRPSARLTSTRAVRAK